MQDFRASEFSLLTNTAKEVNDLKFDYNQILEMCAHGHCIPTCVHLVIKQEKCG
jgi:hypothetical protein